MRRAIRPLLLAAVMASAGPATAGILAETVPVKFNLTVRPGEPVARDVAIRNLGDTPVVVRARLSDWTLDERGELDFAPLGTTPNSLRGLVTFEPAQFSLQPGESGVIHLTMQLPAAGGPATRWGVLLSEVRPTSWPATSFGPRAIAELGTTLYLSRIAAEETRAELVGMDVSPRDDSTLSLALRVRNPGERHLYCSGQIAVRDSAGAAVASGELGTGVVLPATQRIFTWTCPSRLARGRYTVAATLDAGEPELIVGETEFRWPLPPAPAVPVALHR